MLLKYNELFPHIRSLIIVYFNTHLTSVCLQDPMSNKLKGFHGLSLVNNLRMYYHLIKWH